MAKQDDLVVATQVRKEFGGLVATDDVDFSIPRGALDEPLYEMRGADEPGAGERGSPGAVPRG